MSFDRQGSFNGVVTVSTHCQPLDNLRHLIRSGECPDQPSLIAYWLERESCCDKGRGKTLCWHCPKAQQWQHYEQQFRLLLDAVADELLPAHWRCACLDNIYRPLHQLKRLADNKQLQVHLQRLLYELSATGDYVKQGLVG